MGSILVLRWAGSAYDSLGGLLGLVAQELAAFGRRVVMFAADGQEWPRQLVTALQQEPYDFALTMSGIGIDLSVPNKGLLWETCNVPIFNWSCDHPCYYPQRHAIRSRYVMHGYVFPDHAHYNLRYLNPNGMAFCVHIGMPPRRMLPDAPQPLSERNGRIIFSKSGQDSNAIAAEWQNRLPLFRAILLGAAEELFHRSTADFVPVLQRVAEPYGLLLDGNNELTLSLIRELDAYIRFRRGDLVMRALLDYPVDVFGTGWEHLPWAGARAVFHGSMHWRVAAVDLLPRYLGCLSINPLVNLSLHDRVFFAIAAGVPPLSDANGFAQVRLPMLAPYSFDFTPEHVAAAADALLSDPAEALARTEAAYQALLPDSTMQHAAAQLIQFATLHGANARCAL